MPRFLKTWLRFPYKELPREKASNTRHKRSEPILNTVKGALSKKNPSKQSLPGPQSSRSPHMQETVSKIDALWVFEYVAIVISVACFTSILVVLAVHNHQPRSSWTFYFSLNTVVSTLATASKSSMAFAVSAAVSQGKWNWFAHKPDRLSTFQAVDLASRDSLGGIHVLWRLRGGLLVCLGAFIGLISIAIEPMLQAVIDEYGTLGDIAGTMPTALRTPVAMIGSTKYMSGGDEFANSMIAVKNKDGNSYANRSIYVDSGVQAAVYGGFQTSQRANSSTQLSVSCSSGNCTWPTFASLAVCSQCYNVSNQLTRTPYINTVVTPDVYYTIPGASVESIDFDNITQYTLSYNRLSINNWNRAWNTTRDATRNTGFAEFIVAQTQKQPESTHNFQDYETLLTAFSIISADPSYIQKVSAWNETQPTAMECGLYLCLHAYNSSTSFGQLNERIVDSTRKKALGSWAIPQRFIEGGNLPNLTAIGTSDWNPINTNGWLPRYDYQLDPSDLHVEGLDTSQVNFNASQDLLDSLTDFLGSMAVSTNHSGYLYPQAAYSRNTSAILYSSSLMQSLYQSENISQTFSDVANSLTSYFRNSGTDTQKGSTQIWEIRFRVRWAYATLPGVFVIGGSMFVLLSIYQTHKQGVPAWKDNAIATMAFSIDEKTRRQLRRALMSQDLDQASQLIVRMNSEADGLELSTTSLHSDTDMKVITYQTDAEADITGQVLPTTAMIQPSRSDRQGSSASNDSDANSLLQSRPYHALPDQHTDDVELRNMTPSPDSRLRSRSSSSYERPDDA